MENDGKIASRPISLADIPRCIRTLYSRWIYVHPVLVCSMPMNFNTIGYYWYTIHWLSNARGVLGDFNPRWDYMNFAGLQRTVFLSGGLLCYRGPVVNSLEDLPSGNYSGFSHSKWWFSMAMLVYQRVFMEAFQTLAFSAKPRYTCPSVDNVLQLISHGRRTIRGAGQLPGDGGCETSRSGLGRQNHVGWGSPKWLAIIFSKNIDH